MNSRINYLHERTLRLVYREDNLSFKGLLRKDNSFSIHHKYISLLAIELYKVKHGLSTEMMNEVFGKRSINHSLRSQTYFPIDRINTVKYGINSLRYFALKYGILSLKI